MRHIKRTAIPLLAMALATAAHMDQASLTLSPAGPYRPGTAITIEWVASQAHDGLYDLYFSPNGGTSWPTEFGERWQGPTTNGAKVTYRWTLPANTANTTQGKIRICQLSGGHCVQPGTYTIMTPNFTISNSTGLREADVAAGLRFEFDALSRTVDLVVPMETGAVVTLKAYDAAGKEGAELLSRRLEAGTHRLSVFANRLEGHGPLLFRLARGAETTTWSVAGEQAR